MSSRYLTEGVLPFRRSIHLLAVLFRFAVEEGIAPGDALASTGLVEKDFEDPQFLCTTAQEVALIRNLTALIPSSDGLGLRIGSRYHLGVLGPISAAAMHSEILRDAIPMIYRYRELIGSFFQFDVGITATRVTITLREVIDLKDVRTFICERELISIKRVLSDLIGEPLVLDELRVGYPAPRYADRYSELVGCPVEFGFDEHTLVFDAAWLERRLPLADPLACRVAVRDCEKALVRVRGEGPISQRVIQEIVFRGDRVPDLDVVAHNLNMSPRTLRRRLEEEGVTYRGIIQRLQFDESIRLLHTTSRPIADIARDVGFQDLPNFYRAFRRWTGTTPGEYRSRATDPAVY